MNDFIIKIENLEKQYELFEKPIDRLKEALNPFGKKYHREFFALDNINFEIKKGETVGLIGKNGAGKSTLLKIITGVLTPNKGQVTVKGRISSLLELGAGFNMEMTGIENIYLNGTIMGFSNTEIDKKINSILDFADIGDFIHQPVKTYSSGMFARLAFSVAINVEPDILIVDEALSVGDFAFQYKCIMRFKELQRKNVTILFVSHDMQQILKSCSKAIFLHDGKIKEISENVEEVVFNYETTIREAEKVVDNNLNNQVEHRFGDRRANIDNISFIQSTSNNNLISGNKTILRFDIESNLELNNPMLGFSLRNKNGISIWGDSIFTMEEKFEVYKGKNTYEILFDLNIVPGEYFFYIGLSIFENNKKLDIDQRWRVMKINIVSKRSMSEGYVYAPTKLKRLNL